MYLCVCVPMNRKHVNTQTLKHILLMKKLLILLVSFTMFYGCANSQEEQNSSKTSAEPAKQEVKQQPAATATPKNNIRQSRTNSNVIRSTSRQKAEVNQVFPYDIDLKDADGKVVNTSSLLKGDKPTILLFWLTTCFPCKIEMKAIKAKYPQWKEETDFRLVAISTDFMKNEAAFQKMAKEKGWEWEVYHDFNREFRHVMPGALNGLPQTFIVDTNGEVVYHKRKYSTGDEDKLYAKVKELAMK